MLRDKVYYHTEYTEKERSIYDIADEHGVYPNKIRREIQACGISLRTRSQAQSAAIKHGRHQHPTKGKRRSDEVRNKISETMAGTWQAMDEEERLRRAACSRKQWDGMSDEQREQFRELAAKAVRRASKEGSKLERFIQCELLIRGHHVEFHPQEFKVQVDILLTRLNACILVDGPSHFLPIWGEKHLDKKIAQDGEKIELLMQNNIAVIRVKHLIKTLSEVQKRKLLDAVLEHVDRLLVDRNEQHGWLAEIEVK